MFRRTGSHNGARGCGTNHGRIGPSGDTMGMTREAREVFSTPLDATGVACLSDGKQRGRNSVHEPVE